MKDLRKATVTIANASNKEQSFVPYAQSFLYKLAPQDAIQFPANSIQAIYYGKQNQGPIAAQAIGEDDTHVEPKYVSLDDTYMYVGGKLVGGINSERQYQLRFYNPQITTKDQLPEDAYFRIHYVTLGGYREWAELTKEDAQDDGSFYYNSELAPDFVKNEIKLNIGNGDEEYQIDSTNLVVESGEGPTPPTPTIYTIDDSGIQNGYNSGDQEIEENGTATITIVANAGYVIPQTITQDNIVGATYNNDYNDGTFTISNPTSDVVISCVCEAEQPQPTGLTPFYDGTDGEHEATSIKTGDYIVFDKTKGSNDGSDCDILTFLQSLESYYVEIPDSGGMAMYDLVTANEGVTSVVTAMRTGSEGNYIYMLVCSIVGAPAGWSSATVQGIMDVGWNGLDSDGKAQTVMDALVNNVSGIQGWNAVIVGYEEGQA